MYQVALKIGNVKNAVKYAMIWLLTEKSLKMHSGKLWITSQLFYETFIYFTKGKINWETFWKKGLQYLGHLLTAKI